MAISIGGNQDVPRRATPMGPFYAYLKYEGDSRFPYFITFVNREAADEWWRMISAPPSPFAQSVERISPQFYVQSDAPTHDVSSFFSCAVLPDAQRFRKKMYLTMLINSGHFFPIHFHETAFTDHISGGWYFIRSKVDPWSYWYFRTNGACLVCGDANCDAIHVSNEYRTNLCVRVRTPGNDSQVAKDFVMIEQDEISIAAPKGYIVHVNNAGDLKATKGHQGETDLLFGDLKKRFITRAVKQVNGEIWEYVESVERGEGEGWELVG